MLSRCSFAAVVALFAFAAACSRTPERASARPNVLLITVDTLRADRISAGGSPDSSRRITTPRLDALAAEGLRFTRVETPRAKTTPAIASLMTGLYPHGHGVRDLLARVPVRVPLLAERLQSAGWRTAAIVGNFVLKNEYSGLARGFDAWVEDLPDTQGVPPENVAQRTARSLTDGALVALGLATHAQGEAGPAEPFVHAGEPWFLWLHYMDPHGAYEPPPEHRVFTRTVPELIAPELPARPNEIHKRWIAEYNVPASARTADGSIDAALVRDSYDGEVHYVDAEIGRLMDRLRAEGLLERTIVVITADHGESLGEQDYWFEHGRNVSEATCRVPLIVRLPASMPDRPAPGVRQGDLSLVDVAPTLLDLLHVQALCAGRDAGGDVGRIGSVRGESRVDLLLRDDPVPRAVFCEKIEREEKTGVVQSKAVRFGDWKYVRRYTRGVSDATRLVVLGEELYDLAKDPSESNNLAASPPREAPFDRLRAELLRFAGEDVRFAELGAELMKRRSEIERDDPETGRILRSLGY